MDTQRPNVARMYNWFLGDPGLGGKDTSEVDREAASQALARNPKARDYAIANREFLGRAVGYLAGEAGIDQFLDLGTGYPNMGNVHEVARRFQPEARTVYVDYDPVVACHGRALLAVDEHTHMLELDMRAPEKIVNACRNGSLLDLSRPVGVLAVAVLHFIAREEEPYRILRTVMDALAPGSYLVVTHVLSAAETIAAAGAYASTSAPVTLRSQPAIERFFSFVGARLVEPGVVRVPLWRADERTSFRDEVAAMHLVGGVGVRS
ncbi:SAM-dependent methyltransferase [Nonomuraea sp. NPDC048916]|uniref:SAM-dependent methyltransferase n=1 Tax=Nonomuraea sp. NPDC048916 TaxID=3154232 RepID=UPI0033CA475C